MARTGDLFDSPLAGPIDSIPLTASNTAQQVPDGYACFRGLHVVTDGTMTLTMITGVDRTFAAGHFALGVNHAMPFTRLKAGSTAAIHGLL